LNRRLSLQIENGQYLGVRQSWKDGKKQRIEDSLGSFIETLKLMVSAMEQKRINEERKKVERDLWQIRYQVQKREKEIEDKKIAKLEEETNN